MNGLFSKITRLVIGESLGPGDLIGVEEPNTNKSRAWLATCSCPLSIGSRTYLLSCGHPFTDAPQGSKVFQYKMSDKFGKFEPIREIGEIHSIADFSRGSARQGEDWMVIKPRRGLRLRRGFRKTPKKFSYSSQNSQPSIHEKVFMIGGKSGHREGQISGFSRPAIIRLGNGKKIQFAKTLIEVTPIEYIRGFNKRSEHIDFGSRGDSGSLVIAEQAKSAFGILLTSSTKQSVMSRGYTLPVWVVWQHVDNASHDAVSLLEH